MRQIVRLKGTNQVLPFDYFSLLTSYIHKCLGENNKYHDVMSNYAISSLYGTKMTPDKSGLDFSNGGYFTISSLDNEFIITLLTGIVKNRILFHDIKFDYFDDINEQFHDGWNHFSTLSPIILRKKTECGHEFSIFSDVDFEHLLEEQTKRKLKTLFNVDADLKINVNVNSGKTKNVRIHNSKNTTNYCQISILCNKDIANMIYNIGIGQLTGCGFGTLYKTSNHDFYRI